MSGEPRKRVGGWATDSLTDDERRTLLRAALDDQQLFDALVEEEGLRELLADPTAREQVLAVLEQPRRGDRLRAWLRRPATLGDLLTATAALAVALVAVQLYRAAPPPAVATARPPAHAVALPTLERLAALPARRAVPADLEAERPPARVRAGETLALRLAVGGPAQLLLLDARPDRSVAQAWPPSGRPPAFVPAAGPSGRVVRTVRLPPTTLPGHHRLRLVVAPPGFDLGAATPADVDREAARLTTVDLSYQVEKP